MNETIRRVLAPNLPLRERFHRRRSNRNYDDNNKRESELTIIETYKGIPIMFVPILYYFV